VRKRGIYWVAVANRSQSRPNSSAARAWPRMSGLVRLVVLALICRRSTIVWLAHSCARLSLHIIIYMWTHVHLAPSARAPGAARHRPAPSPPWPASWGESPVPRGCRYASEEGAGWARLCGGGRVARCSGPRAAVVSAMCNTTTTTTRGRAFATRGVGGAMGVETTTRHTAATGRRLSAQGSTVRPGSGTRRRWPGGVHGVAGGAHAGVVYCCRE